MGFLGKARKMISGKGTSEPPRPQYYQVACSQGHVIRGERTEGYQALRCPHCGDGIFVLPRSPLPIPPAPASVKTKARRRPAEIDDRPIALAEAPAQEDLEEIQWLEPVPAQVRDPDQRVARPRAVPPLPAAEPILEAVAAEAAEAPSRPRSKPRKPRPRVVAPAVDMQSVAPGQILVKESRRRGSPLVWLTFGIVILISGTIGYRVWRQRLQDLPQQAELNRTEGIEALEKGLFDDAKAKLGRAAKAYDTLGSRDELAVSTTQLSKEAAILADLAHDPLKDILDEVARLGDPEGIERFQSIHKGQAVLIDSEIASAAGGTVDLHIRIFVGRGPAPAKIGRFDLTGFRFFEGDTTPKKGDKVFFGARLDTIRLENGEWLITLEPESGVVMTNDKALNWAAMGPRGTGEASP